MAESMFDQGPIGGETHLYGYIQDPDTDRLYCVRVRLASAGVAIAVEGYGRQTSEPGWGEVVEVAFTEVGELYANVYGDINSRLPTSGSTLEEAKEDLRHA